MTVKILICSTVLLLSKVSWCWGWSHSPSPPRVVDRRGGNNNCGVASSNACGLGSTRRETFAKVATTSIIPAFFTTVTSAMTTPIAVGAHEISPTTRRNELIASTTDKKIGVGNEELAQIITRDVRDNQFMVRADLTRSVYDESATFTDEIDTYTLDSWIQGTKRLFVPDKSSVKLVPDSLRVTDQEARFLFTEYLTFNIPFLLPKVYLSGEVILKRDPATGLITSYQEKWDQELKDVYKNFKFGGQ